MEVLNNTMNLIYVVENKSTINEILNSQFHFSARLKTKLIKSKNVLLNGLFIDTRLTANPGDTITIILDYPEDNSNIVSKKMDLDILYEDAFLLAINKPYGIPVHPSILHFEDSLSNGVKYYFDKIGLYKKIRPINRIDLNTSGLVLFAKCEYVQECLIKQMQDKAFLKTYLALVYGTLNEKIGTIKKPIARKGNSIIERCISPIGQEAVTHYKVIKEFNDYSLLECNLETGRTHQIRVHLSSMGNPLLGDTLYGYKGSTLINRQALHSYKMEFIHPIFEKSISITSPIPNDIKKLL